MTAWQDHAACATVPNARALFFTPEREGSGRESGQHQRIAKAKVICMACPVRAACLTHALEHNERHGIWGGKTTRERVAMRRDSVVRGVCEWCGRHFVRSGPRDSKRRTCGDACRAAKRRHSQYAYVSRQRIGE